QIEQLDAARLKYRSEVSRTVVSRENKRTQRRHLPSIESASKLRCLPLLFRAADFVALDPFTQRSLDRRQDSVAPFYILAMLLIIIEPKRRVNAYENEDKFRCPATDACEKRTLFSCFTHSSTPNT